MKQEDRKYSVLPDRMGDSGLAPKDQLVYVGIRSFMNKDTMEAYPSLRAIARKIGYTVKGVRSSLARLSAKGYVEIARQGRRNVYRFMRPVSFQPFSDRFLEDDRISFETKAYLVASQQYMICDVEDYGRVDYSGKELARRINVSDDSVRRYDSELKRKGFLSIVPGGRVDRETGCRVRSRIYDMGKLGQAIIWKLKEHDERIFALEEENERVREENKRLLESTERQEKALSEMRELLKRLLDEREDGCLGEMEMF